MTEWKLLRDRISHGRASEGHDDEDQTADLPGPNVVSWNGSAMPPGALLGDGNPCLVPLFVRRPWRWGGLVQTKG